MLIAFHGKTDLKLSYLTKLTQHRAQIVQNAGYWNGQRGCAVGVTINGSNHGRYESELGLPVELSAAELALFDSMSAVEANLWPLKILAAIPVGADVITAWRTWLSWMVRDLSSIPGLPRSVASAIRHLADCFDRSLAGDEPTANEWAKAVAALKRYKGRHNAAQAAWSARGAWAAKVGWKSNDLHGDTTEQTTRAEWTVQTINEALRAWGAASELSIDDDEDTWDEDEQEDVTTTTIARRYSEKLIECLQKAPMAATSTQPVKPIAVDTTAPVAPTVTPTVAPSPERSATATPTTAPKRAQQEALAAQLRATKLADEHRADQERQARQREKAAQLREQKLAKKLQAQQAQLNKLAATVANLDAQPPVLAPRRSLLDTLPKSRRTTVPFELHLNPN